MTVSQGASQKKSEDNLSEDDTDIPFVAEPATLLISSACPSSQPCACSYTSSETIKPNKEQSPIMSTIELTVIQSKEGM